MMWKPQVGVTFKITGYIAVFPPPQKEHTKSLRGIYLPTSLTLAVSVVSLWSVRELICKSWPVTDEAFKEDRIRPPY